MSRICPYCKLILNNPGSHIKACGQLHGDENWKYNFYVFNFPKLKDRNFLYQCYVIDHDSLPILCKKVGGLDLKAMCWILNYYGIKTRSVSTALKLNETRQRINETNLKIYGAINPLSRGTTAFYKRNETVKRKYGVDNVWQCVDKFVDFHGNHSKISSLNLRLIKLFEDNNIPYEREYIIHYVDDCGKTRYKFYDFKIGNTIIEVNGDYWHANPQKYPADAVFTFPKSVCTAKNIWDADNFKADIAKKNGYKVLYIWESFMKRTNDYDLLQYIKNNID